jgi:hypothetical protein
MAFFVCENTRSHRQGASKKATRWDLWLQKYNEAAINAEIHGCVELGDLALVLEDFMDAVQSVDLLWIESVRLESKTR